MKMVKNLDIFLKLSLIFIFILETIKFDVDQIGT